ncbi:MAG TPA: hypothetical protein IAA60_03000 [Candidatus Ornithomonoglobus intestinigallinarum]|uniref:SH3b domain-containing protein n=1 Tax=Candidatus Ornithomonoglobus intestinigallinarum TaxID=2840894 RepID=A0A9D1KQR6_9FIRM|nr:hypothetical protein [Candidatus Ornithomonoglobus intestinigallinarum]
MKKIKKVITSVLMVSILSVFIITPLSANAVEYLYVSGAETGAVYLRTAPASSGYYTTLTNGTMVESIGWTRGWDGEGYNQVRVDGITGWITTKYLSSYYNLYSDYSFYRMSRVVGVENSIYLWTDAYGSGSYCTIPLGSLIFVNYGTYTNGRCRAAYGGLSGWVTERYIIPW